MSDILSQSEIDNLSENNCRMEILDVDQIQGEDEKQAKNYDFSRPTKFSKEHLRTLETYLNITADWYLLKLTGISA